MYVCILAATESRRITMNDPQLHTQTPYDGLPMPRRLGAVLAAAPVVGSLVGSLHPGALGGTGLAAMAAGLVSLAWLPEQPVAGDIVWRLPLPEALVRRK